MEEDITDYIPCEKGNCANHAVHFYKNVWYCEVCKPKQNTEVTNESNKGM